jgi:alkaline phosphatase D
MKRFPIAILFFLLAQSLIGQQSLLQSGPMLGYTDMLEASIWVQTTQKAKVFAMYAPIDQPNVENRTNTIETSKESAFTALLIADSIEPGKEYLYDIYINDQKVTLPYSTTFQTQTIWKWRGNPPNFTMLTGSCAYINQPEHDRPGTPYGGDYRIFENMASHEADLMLWLGDNVYLREADWNTTTGIHGRYTHSRSIKELQPLLASTHHYAIWDDHDYGPNDSDKGFYMKDITMETFRNFWANPSYGTSEMPGAITSFQWGDADFFLLDNRWYRDADKLLKDQKTILGSTQLEWLFNNLVTSTATFKIVAMGGQLLSDAGLYELYSANGFEKERQQIIDFIHAHQIRNVIFLTGDVHFTELSALRKEGLPTIWDLTFSTLTAGPNKNGDQWKNSYRIPGTVVTERNFGKIHFTGERNHRKLIVSCFNTDNTLMWEQTIRQE